MIDWRLEHVSLIAAYYESEIESEWKDLSMLDYHILNNWLKIRTC